MSTPPSRSRTAAAAAAAPSSGLTSACTNRRGSRRGSSGDDRAAMSTSAPRAASSRVTACPTPPRAAGHERPPPGEVPVGAHGWIARPAMRPSRSVKSKSRSTGLPGKLPSTLAVRTVRPSRSTTLHAHPPARARGSRPRRSPLRAALDATRRPEARPRIAEEPPNDVKKVVGSAPAWASRRIPPASMRAGKETAPRLPHTTRARRRSPPAPVERFFFRARKRASPSSGVRGSPWTTERHGRRRPLSRKSLPEASVSRSSPDALRTRPRRDPAGAAGSPQASEGWSCGFTRRNDRR